MGILYHFGRYSLFMTRVFGKSTKPQVVFKQIFTEMGLLGISSIGIIVIISFFMGAVTTLQTAYNFALPYIPKYIIALVTRDSVFLEFSSTMICLILAGKTGSQIASEIGAMRITEQIDALELMGVNSANFLALPKIIGLMFIVPFLTIISMGTGVFGGWVAGVVSGTVQSADYLQGIFYAFVPYYIFYSIIKSVVFVFIITSIAAYYGYTVSGGSLEVGRSSTKAVVASCVLILIFDLILTQLILP